MAQKNVKEFGELDEIGNSHTRTRRSIVAAAPPAPIAQIVSWEAIDSTHIRVTFDRPVLNNAGLVCIDQYEISTSTPGAVVPFILAITPEAVAEPTYVTLTTTEMTNDAVYEGNIETLEPA